MTFLANPAAIMLNAAALAIDPPEDVDFNRWARDNIVFSKRESAYAGPYNPELFPFFTEILKALGPDDPCRIVTLMKSAQLGGTVLANIFTLGTQAMDPCDLMYIHPTEDNAVRWSKLKLKPMLRQTPSVARLFPERSRDGGDSVLFKERADGRGSILISGANSPASLSQVTVPRQIQDDLAKWTMNEAGDPELQADSRSQAHEFAKIFKIGTPLIKPGCRISASFEDGSQEVFEVPCPHCGHFHTLEWANMLASLDEAKSEDAHFSCPSCGGLIEAHHRRAMAIGGRFTAQNPAAARHHRSFHLWSAIGPLLSWENVARKWLQARGDPAKERVFLNDVAGLAYEARGEAPPWEALRDRAAKSSYERRLIPHGFWLLTIGIDCQSNRVEWQAVAWGRDNRRQVIDADIITGHIGEEACRKSLDLLLGLEWKHASGAKFAADLTAIDGNAWTEDVWDWARRHPSSKVIMVRGVGQEQAPLLARVARERNRAGKRVNYSKRFYHMGASVLKMALYRNLAKEDPAERGYVGFPKGLPDEYFRQLTAESRRAVKRKDGFIDYRWEKDPNQANEMLDTMIQAEAAAIKRGVRIMPDEVWNELEHARGSAPAEAQLDLEDLMTAPRNSAPPPAPEAAAAPKPAAGTWFDGNARDWL